MSDKELDKLFHDKFESFEVEPSVELWPNINAQLVNKKVRKPFPIFWMAAASIVVVFTAGLYFMQPKETIKLQGKSKPIAKTAPVVNKDLSNPVKAGITQGTDRLSIADQKEKRTSLALSKAPAKRNQIHATNSKIFVEDAILAGSIPAAMVSPEPIKVPSDQNLTHPKPMEAIPIIKQQPPLASLMINGDKNIDTNSQSIPSRKLKSLGDLVNRVIATIDPREEKIIEFTDNDEGTELSGINLGILKIKHNHNNK